MATFACLGWRSHGSPKICQFEVNGALTARLFGVQHPLSCLWTELKAVADSLMEARHILRIRELIPARNDQHIGWWPNPSPGVDQIEVLTAWAYHRGIDAILSGLRCRSKSAASNACRLLMK